jgi:hypothetical protein
MANSKLSGPTYYKRGNVEVWDFIRDQGLNYHLGNAIKYIVRAGFKGSIIEDLQKAIHYLNNELENQINIERASHGVSQSIPSRKQHNSSSTDYATEFDR